MIVSDMAGRSNVSKNKIIVLNNSNCACCLKPIFHFEGRVRAVDLDESEKAACVSLRGASTSCEETLKRNDAVLCVLCYRKSQPGGPADSSSESETDDTDIAGGSAVDRPVTRRATATDSESPSQNTERQTSSTTALPKDSSRAAEQEQIQKEPSQAGGATDATSSGATLRGDSGKHLTYNMFSLTGSAPVVVGAIALVALGTFGFGMTVYLAISTVIVVLMVKRYMAWRWPQDVTEWFDWKKSASDVKPEAPRDLTTAIMTGASLAGTTTYSLLVQNGYSVTCGIEVENWTRFPLAQPNVEVQGGALVIAPSTILQATREVMVARKTSGTATGSYGTVSWLIEALNRRVVVMWSAPFNFNHHSNWLAVGLTAPGTTKHAPGNAWFNRMYYENSSQQLMFERGEYYANVRPVLYRDSDVEVEGIMSSDHIAVVKIIVRPVAVENFAGNIRHIMEQK